jgi:type IV fimbrial biogenesis protein FimT
MNIRGTWVARGFTIIEAMIALAVMGVLLAVGLPAFGEMMANARIRESAESVVALAQFARAEAVKRNAPVTFALVSNHPATSGWTPAFSCIAGGAPHMAVYVEPSPGVFVLIDSKPAPTNAVGIVAATPPATASGACGAIVFGALGDTTLSADATIDVNMSIGAPRCTHDASGSQRCLRVLVSPGGGVKMCDPAASAGDSRACTVWSAPA